VSLLYLVPFVLLVSFAGRGLLLVLILHVTDNGWDLGNTKMMVTRRRGMAEEEIHVLRARCLGTCSRGKKMAPTTAIPPI